MNHTETQIQRLQELGLSAQQTEADYETAEERDRAFKEMEAGSIAAGRERLKDLLEVRRQPLGLDVEERLATWLRQEAGFTRVSTPLFITEQQLARMSIDTGHPLRQQVFRVDNGRYLRPMLAPNLYELMLRLYKSHRKPVRIFEAGPCFRKESQGALHLNEFTMLNLVEFPSVADGAQRERLRGLAEGAMRAVGLEEYRFEVSGSEVYGETVDIEWKGTELASGAYGPHPLDANFGIFDTSWVGLGIGIERVALALRDENGIKRYGRSLTFLDGVRLNF